MPRRRRSRASPSARAARRSPSLRRRRPRPWLGARPTGERQWRCLRQSRHLHHRRQGHSVCTISGSTVSFIGAGTCVIDANQAGNGNYNAAPQAQQSFAVGKGSQTITFTSTAPSSAVVGGADLHCHARTGNRRALPVTLHDRRLGQPVCSISGTGELHRRRKLRRRQPAASSNYCAPQRAGCAAQGQPDDQLHSRRADLGRGRGGDLPSPPMAAPPAIPSPSPSTPRPIRSAPISGSTVSFIGTGTCVIDANQAGSGAYNAAPQAQQSFAVGKGSQTITFSSTAPTSAVVGGATYR